jgi:glycosyltransferase involved in cell wall biosynthesis
VVCTNTFYAPLVAMRAGRSRVPVVNWIFDLFPDVLVAGQKIRSGGLLERRLGDLTRAAFRQAAANVFLGERLRRHAEERYGPIPRSHVIPVGADGEAFGAVEPTPRGAEAPLRVLYCGNFGRMHETRTIAALLRDPGPPGWTVDFRGHGAGFRELTAVTAQNAGRVTFAGSLRDDEWVRAMRDADVALVTMKPGTAGLVMPSKTYSAMMAGQAILAICPLESDLADTVRRDDAGWVVAPGDAEGLRAILTAAAADPAAVLTKRRNARRAGRQRYDEKVLAARWADLLLTLIV